MKKIILSFFLLFSLASKGQTLKISELPDNATIDTVNSVPMVDSSTTKEVTFGVIKRWIQDFTPSANIQSGLDSLADSAIVRRYITIQNVAASITAGVVAGTYGFSYRDSAIVSGTGTAYPLAIIYIASADYPTMNGRSPKLRIRAELAANDVAPTGNFTIGLYPITRPGTSGAAGVNIYTLGTVVAGSNGASFTTPAADALAVSTGADFALPSDGYYVIGLVTTATVAASSHVHINAQLQLHNN